MSAHHTFAATTLALLAAALPATTASAVAYDYKGVSPSTCQPYAPDTTAAELQVNQSGVYNPGTTTEKVICPLPRDMEGKYIEDALVLGIYYRVLGAAPGRVTCTAFVGSTGMQSEAVVTSTGSGPLVSAGTRSVLWLYVPAQTTTFNVVPDTLICAILPKTQLAAIYFEEQGTTDYVQPAVGTLGG